MICWNNPKKNLASAVLVTKNYNRSNLNGHLLRCHAQSEVPDMYSDISTITKSVSLSSTSLTQKKITNYGNDDQVTPSIGLSYLYNFFNEANIAINQANNKNLKAFIDFLIDNGNQMKLRKEDCYFTRYKYKKLELESFKFFLHSVRNVINFCRGYYKEKLKVDNTPFLMVSHDGWDSKDNDMLGVSIHLCVPKYWMVLNIAVGLKRVTSKKSKATVEAIKVILNR
jgi:hypothetical protein